MSGLILICAILYFTNFGIKAQLWHDLATVTEDSSLDQINSQTTTESVKAFNYTCKDETILKLSNNDSLVDYLKQCPSTKKIDVIGETKRKFTINVSIKSLDPSDNVQINLNYISEIHFEDEQCSPLITFSLTEVREFHIHKKMYNAGCVTFDKAKTMIAFMTETETLESDERELNTTEDTITKHTTTEHTILANRFGHEHGYQPPSSSDKSVVTSLAAVVAVMSIAMVSLIFYAFCFKSPVKGRKLKEAKRSITIEPATELQARRPTILLETHKTIAEEARDASVKQKIRRNNSIKMLEKEKKVAKKMEGEAHGAPSEHMIQIESDAEEVKCTSKVLETSAQVHATDDKDNMPELVVGTLDPTKEPNFELTQVTPLQTPSTEETKINMDISEDEASNVHLGNVLDGSSSQPNTDKAIDDKKAEENKRTSRIPVPVHSRQSSSAESITSKGSNKKSSKDVKSAS